MGPPLLALRPPRPKECQDFKQHPLSEKWGASHGEKACSARAYPGYPWGSPEHPGTPRGAMGSYMGRLIHRACCWLSTGVADGGDQSRSAEERRQAGSVGRPQPAAVRVSPESKAPPTKPEPPSGEAILVLARGEGQGRGRPASIAPPTRCSTGA